MIEEIYMSNIPETACSLLWTHAALDMDGAVMPCCRFQVEMVIDPVTGDAPRQDSRMYKNPDYKKENIPYMNEGGLDKAFNGDEYTQMREAMLRGEKLKGCAKCWEIENSGGVDSPRQFWNRRYFDQIGKPPKIKYLELGFSTHCNLACRMCSPEYSSKWHNIVFPEHKVEVGFTDFIKNLDADLSEVENIKFVGGEPMMDKNHDRFIENLEAWGINLSKLNLFYHTNGTIMPGDNVIRVWEKLANVTIVISIDGYGEVNEYHRPGHKFSDLEKNLLRYKELPVKIETHTVVTQLNVFYLQSLIDWLDKMEIDPRRSDFDPSNFPLYLSIRSMDEDKKLKAIKYVEGLSRSDIKPRLINKIKMDIPESDGMGDDHVLKVMKPLDEYFGTDTKDYL